MYQEMKQNGELVKKVGNKGVCLTRRDNCNFVRKIYEGLVKKIFHNESPQEVLTWVHSECCKLLLGDVSVQDLVISKAVQSVGKLPTTNSSIAHDWTIKHHAACLTHREREELFKEKGFVKLGNYKVKLLPVQVEERNRLMRLKEARTPLEYYINSLPAHVALAVKIRSRGTQVPVGSRLQFIVLERKGCKKLRSKIEDVEYFKRHSQVLRVDKMYYLKQLINPVDQLMKAWNKKYRHFTQHLVQGFVTKKKLLEEINPSPKIKFL